MTDDRIYYLIHFQTNVLLNKTLLLINKIIKTILNKIKFKNENSFLKIENRNLKYFKK